MRVRDIMTRAVVTVGPEDPIAKATDLLASLGFTALPVVDDAGRVHGVVTEADLINNSYPLGFASDAPAADTEPKRLIGEVMSTPPICVRHDADTALLARIMINDHLRSLPVIDGDRLAGMVTRRDLLRTLARSDAEIAGEVRRVLAPLGGKGRWTVHVDDGRALVEDEFSEASDRTAARTIAESVRGVLRAEVTGPDRVATPHD